MEIKSCIIYEDSQLLVCHKPAGLAVQNARIGVIDLESALKNYLAEQTGRMPYLAVIHRLDLPVEGVLVFAKTKESAKALNAALTAGRMEKCYLAMTGTRPAKESGELTDWLKKDGRQNCSHVVPEQTVGAKQAKLHYTLLRETAEGFLLEIRLLTGRHHQIRVQMANAGMPLLGDRKYGKSDGSQDVLRLCAYRLCFPHPVTKKKMEFEIVPDGWQIE